MRFLPKAFLFVVVASLSQAQAATTQQPDPRIDPVAGTQAQPQVSQALNSANLVVPAGTKVILSLTGPVWSKSAHIGDSVYGVTAFPVSINNTMAIPPGTYVEGQIDSITRPTRKTNRAEFQMHFTKMIFANGYAVTLPVPPANPAASQNAPNKDPLAQEEVPVVNAAATALVHVDIYFTSDILLDNGSQIEMDLQSPIALDAASVAAAIPESKPPQLQQASATRCRPVAGTSGSPGTPDTVIPGTPSTTIPGGPGMPDITIPGTPATVIPGTPGSSGTPGIYCPGPPAVISEAGDVHKESFKLGSSAALAGRSLPKGTYQVTWNGPGPDARVQILQRGEVVATVQAHVATLLDKSAKSGVDTSSGVPPAVLSIQFKGKSFALTFDPGSPQNATQASAQPLGSKP